MIVVDSNVVAYCWLNGPLTALAQGARQRDPDWHVPVLWRSEVRSALAGFCRSGALDWGQAVRIMAAAQQGLAQHEHLPASAAVLGVGEFSGLSAYDAEFVALARQLRVPLVTEDRAVLKAFPDEAVSLKQFVQAG